MSEIMRGEMPEAQKENKSLAVAKAIVKANEKYLAEQGDLTEKERELVIEAMHHAKFAVMDAIKDLFHDKEGWNDVEQVHDNLNYGWEESENE